MFINIFILILILLIITFIIIQNKNKKNIGQKISFLYNQLYIFLINGYYKDSTEKKDILKEEILDYYVNVIENNKLEDIYRYGQDIKGFIVQYYNNDVNIIKIYELSDSYYRVYYKSIKKSIAVLIFTLFVLLLLIIYINLIK